MATRKINSHKICRSQGFSLIEVMIALAIFSVFITAFVTSQGFNISDSARFKDEVRLQLMSELKLNEIIANPPELSERLTLTPETGDMEEDTNYRFSVTYKVFELPDFEKINDTNAGERVSPEMVELQRRIYDNVKNNIKELLWQVEVVITDKTTQESFSASTWLYNHAAQVQFGGF